MPPAEAKLCRDCNRNIAGVCKLTRQPVPGNSAACMSAKTPPWRGACLSCKNVNDCDYDGNSCWYWHRLSTPANKKETK